MIRLDLTGNAEAIYKLLEEIDELDLIDFVNQGDKNGSTPYDLSLSFLA